MNWATLYEILVIKISKNKLTQQKFNKIIWFRTLISPKTVSHHQLHSVVEGRAQIGHSSYIVKVSVLRLHSNTSNPGVYWRNRPNQWAHLQLCHRNSDILEECWTGSRYPTQLQGGLHSCKFIKQPEHGRTSTTKDQKSPPLSDKLWLIANNCKSFANRSKSIIRNNLGLCKRSEMYLI